MLERFYKWFPLRSGESGLVFGLGFILFANYAAMGITKVVAVSGFLNQVKDQYILLVWAVDMVLLVLATGVQSLIVDRFNRIKLMAAVLIGFALLYLLLPFAFLVKSFPQSIGYTLVYLLNDQQWRFFPVLFWILVNDIYDPATGRRVMPVIASFAFIGTIVGLEIAAVDARQGFGTPRLLLLNAAIFIAAFVVLQVRLKSVNLSPPAPTQDSMRETFVDGWTFIKTIPAFAYVAFGMIGTGCVMTILLYDAISDSKLGLGSGFQSFYAQYNMIIAIVSIFIQGLSSRIIERLSLKRSFLIQPLMMLGATIGNFFLPGFVSSSIAQGAARSTYDTVDLSSRKAFQALVPNEKRGRVSMFIDSYLPSIGTIVGSLVTFSIITVGIKLGYSRDYYSLAYLGFAILIAIVSVFSAFRVIATYETSMLSWQLKRRSRGASVLSKLDFGDEDK
jgi:MFS family permease